MRPRLAVLAVLAVAGLLLTATACGGDDGDDATPRSSTTRARSSTTTATTASTTTATSTTTASTTTTTATSATTSTSASTTASTTTAPPTTSPPGTTAPGSSTTAITPGAPTPEAAAQGLYLAWKGGDRVAALAVALPKAVDALFAQPYTGPEMQFQGCRLDGDIWACPYSYEGGFRAFRVQGSAAAGFRVIDVIDAAD